MNTSGNVRSTASKEAVCNALTMLLEEKAFDKISVKEIVQRAGVNRSTFYVHYLDINDLMEKIESKMSAPLLAGMYAEDATVNTVFNEVTLSDFVVYFRRNRAFYRTFFAAHHESSIIQDVAAHVKKNMIEPELMRTKHFSHEEFDLQFEFCMAGFFGVISAWLDSDCAESDEVVANVLQKLIWKCLS